MIKYNVHGLHMCDIDNIVFMLFIMDSCFAPGFVVVSEMQKIPGYAVPVETSHICYSHIIESMDCWFLLKTSIRVSKCIKYEDLLTSYVFAFKPRWGT